MVINVRWLKHRRSTMVMTSVPLTIEQIETLRKEFYDDPCNIIAQNASTQTNPSHLCINRAKFENPPPHIYSHKIDIQTKPVSNQKSSGRCWIFACLNVIRHSFMKQFNISEFEFSHSFLYFWDKLERCNYFLNSVVEVFQKGEEVDGRLASFLLHDPTQDGGQWDMIVNLVLKYGLMPKACFSESASSEASAGFNKLVRKKLRQFAKELRDLVKDKSSEETLKKQMSEQMKVLYRMISIHLGVPPSQFTWEYYDKDDKYHKLGPITPKEFYEKHVKPLYNIEDKVCLVTDPRPENPYNRAYTVAYLGNMVGGRKTVYNNQPVEKMMEVTSKAIQEGEPVWFGCDVSNCYSNQLGALDLDIFDIKSFFGAERTALDKAERLLYGDTCMTHAMVITALTLDDDGNPVRWRVENSWGEDSGKKGFLCMSTAWFKEYVFEVVVDKKVVSDDILAVCKQEPHVLPAWDPMGSLAQ